MGVVASASSNREAHLSWDLLQIGTREKCSRPDLAWSVINNGCGAEAPPPFNHPCILGTDHHHPTSI